MPSRNTLKQDAPESYYHVYARGINKQTLFLEASDFAYFEKLFVRYLSRKPQQSSTGVPYPSYTGQIELLSFCLMNNHFHMLIHQNEVGSMSHFMRSLMTSYSKYFNLKYKRLGPVFESRYKAAKIDQQSYLEHISRYIHLNPRYWLRYPYSSLKYFAGSQPEWLRPERILSMFSGSSAYLEFLKDYEEHANMLSELKHSLADG